MIARVKKCLSRVFFCFCLSAALAACQSSEPASQNQAAQETALFAQKNLVSLVTRLVQGSTQALFTPSKDAANSDKTRLQTLAPHCPPEIAFQSSCGENPSGIQITATCESQASGSISLKGTLTLQNCGKAPELGEAISGDVDFSLVLKPTDAGRLDVEGKVNNLSDLRIQFQGEAFLLVLASAFNGGWDINLDAWVFGPSFQTSRFNFAEILCRSGTQGLLTCSLAGQGSDADGDGVPDDVDNCRSIHNPDQLDEDENGFGDVCDECTTLPRCDQDANACSTFFDRCLSENLEPKGLQLACNPSQGNCVLIRKSTADCVAPEALPPAVCSIALRCGSEEEGQECDLPQPDPNDPNPFFPSCSEADPFCPSGLRCNFSTHICGLAAEDGECILGDGENCVTAPMDCGECPAGPCGNGVVGAGEECDDRNLRVGDGCDAACHWEAGPLCRNGEVDPGEECDDGNAIAGDGCHPACRVEYCGNGIIEWRLGEECDDGNLRDEDQCSSNCQFEACGDGIVQRLRYEQCDDGNRVNGDGCASNCREEGCPIRPLSDSDPNFVFPAIGYEKLICHRGCCEAERYVQHLQSNDSDGDGVVLDFDRCPDIKNPSVGASADQDCDGDCVPDACDLCPDIKETSTSGPLDDDFDGIGNACDPDRDGDGLELLPEGDKCPLIASGRTLQSRAFDPDEDGIPNLCDNCPLVYNPDQKDSDGGGFDGGDACDLCPDIRFGNNEDLDGDGLGSSCDNCPNDFNPDQSDSDGDEGIVGFFGTPRNGDVCDNCPQEPNLFQEDRDGDGQGDLCDSDRDGDGSVNGVDNCPDLANEQVDLDADGLGDSCDNCPDEANPDQTDLNEDGIGDVCQDFLLFCPAHSYSCQQASEELFLSCNCVEGCCVESGPTPQNPLCEPIEGLSLQLSCDNLAQFGFSCEKYLFGRSLEPGSCNLETGCCAIAE